MGPSLDDFLLRPPLGVLPAVLIPLGVIFCGIRLSKWLKASEIEAIDLAAGFTVSAGLLAAICHGLALAGQASLSSLRIIGTSVAVIGAWNALSLLPQARKGCERLYRFLATSGPLGYIALGLGVVTMVALFAAALGPATDIDSLDYHIGIPLDWLRHGGIVSRPDWFTGRLIGVGEGLNLLGLAMGIDCLGAIFQLSGVVVAAIAVASG